MTTPTESPDDTPVFMHAPVKAEWLARLHEDAIEPSLPIVDSHHHLWDRFGGYDAAQLLADTSSGHRVTATVFVQCHCNYRLNGPEAIKPVGETDFVVAAAVDAERIGSSTRVAAGIVGFADLELGDAVDEVLQAHIEAGQGRFKGIRRINSMDPGFRTHLPKLAPQLLADPMFRRGFARLAPHGLSFDAWMYHPQVRELTALARAFPDTAIVLDHVGTPLGVGPYRGRGDEVHACWLADIRELATCANVCVKLGGLAMLVNGSDLHLRESPASSDELVRLWRPWIEPCIEAFGPERCMFESNFPVDKGMVGYTVLWNAFKKLAAGASAAHKAALFHDTASDFYRL